MVIKQIELKNFRNYSQEKISFSKGMNIFLGKNAQGKTNLLESMVYLSLTRSHRILEERQLIQEEKSAARISCVYEDSREKKLEVTIYPDGKVLKINGQPVKKSSEFIGALNVVLFSPDDLRIFVDVPRERRRILNQEITKINSSYLLALNHYQNLLKERNHYLKRNSINLTYLETIETQMIQDSLPIVKERNEFIQEINRLIVPIYKELSKSEDVIEIQYLCCVEENNKENFQRLYEENRTRDLENHVTNAGIHREDMIFLMNKKPLTNQASQSQKRMCLLSFKLALLEYIHKKTQKQAILLLDDVLSELDQERQESLLKMVQGKNQCFITTTEIPPLLETMKEVEIYQVENGTIHSLKKGNV